MILPVKTQPKLPSAPLGVVGMNYRNRHLISEFRQKKLVAIADDKLHTKRVLEDNQIATPKLLHAIGQIYEKEAVYESLVERGEPFVLKPSKSARGRGVMIFRGIDNDHATLWNGEHMDRSDFFFFIQKTLQGEYSFGRPQDGVLVEERIDSDGSWIMDDLPGAPDIRIVLLDGEPALAMARLPTEGSMGRANLHCGAVGVGISFENHRTLGGIHKNKPIDRHPNTNTPLSGLEVEDFEQCIELCRRCYAATPLDLLGVDLMRDTNRGPVVLEINARPGLGIQVANRKGILEEVNES